MGRKLNVEANKGFTRIENPGKRSSVQCSMCNIVYSKSDPRWLIDHKYVIITFRQNYKLIVH